MACEFHPEAKRELFDAVAYSILRTIFEAEAETRILPLYMTS